MTETMTSLGDALRFEMSRVRKIIPFYEDVPGGKLAAGMMRASIDRAQKALAEDGGVEMIRCHADLKAWEL